jgi:hypothetical protein
MLWMRMREAQKSRLIISGFFAFKAFKKMQLTDFHRHLHC